MFPLHILIIDFCIAFTVTHCLKYQSRMSEFSFPLSASKLLSPFHRVERGIKKRRKLSNPKSETLSSAPSIVIIDDFFPHRCLSPSSLRRKIIKGQKLRNVLNISKVLNSPLRPHCAPCCFPLRSANSGSAAAEQKSCCHDDVAQSEPKIPAI